MGEYTEEMYARHRRERHRRRQRIYRLRQRMIELFIVAVLIAIVAVPIVIFTRDTAPDTDEPAVSDTATPPALAAFPGQTSTPLRCKYPVASQVRGMLAPSATAMQPFFTRASASRIFSSF